MGMPDGTNQHFYHWPETSNKVEEPKPEPKKDTFIGRNDAIAAIKAALKARGLRYSVTGGRGTAWGWITIDIMPGVYKSMTDAERKVAYLKLGRDFGKENGYTSISIAASSDYYREYIDRANGRRPSIIGQPYWD